MSKINVAGVSFSDAEIQQLKENGGTSNKLLTNTDHGVKAKPVVNVVSTDQFFDAKWGEAPKINSGQKVTKPRVKGQESASVVTGPNVDKYNQINAKNRLAELEAQELKAKEVSALDPSKLLASLNALDRQVRRLSKQVKALEAKNNDS